jgi:hypothetical protein
MAMIKAINVLETTLQSVPKGNICKSMCSSTTWHHPCSRVYTVLNETSLKA